MYTITLANGTKLENLELNGNNFISNDIIEDAVFEGHLSTVKISDGTTDEFYGDMVLISNRVEGGKSWFILAEKTDQQKAAEKLEKMVTTASTSITDIQIALAEVYEMILGGI